MKIDIYQHESPNQDFLVSFNDTDLKFLKDLSTLHREAYRWMSKTSSAWLGKKQLGKAIDHNHTLVATLYVTALKEIPTALEAYPELLL